MTRTVAVLAMLAGTLGLSAARAEKAVPDTQPGRLDVFDEAKLFAPAGVEQAKKAFRAVEFHHGLTVTVDTVDGPPAAKKAAAEAASKDAAKWRQFMLDWARETAGHDHAKGVYVLVCLHPVGGVAVVADKQTTQRGFTEANDRQVRDLLTAAFREAKEAKDEAKQQELRAAGLVKAVEYIIGDLKDTRVASAATAEPHGKVQTNAPRQASPILGYVCLGVCVLGGVWLMIALIRMFTGGGGGGGGGVGGGGGGGGFMSSMFGGLFGAVAGMWVYNNLFGGGSMFGGGSDAYAGDAGTGGDAGGADTGAGDWGGGSGDAGGFDGGGGDVGGGGGDFGGDF